MSMKERTSFSLARAMLVNLDELSDAQNRPDPAASNRILRDAFMTDVRPIVRAYREMKDLPPDALEEYRGGSGS